MPFLFFQNIAQNTFSTQKASAKRACAASLLLAFAFFFALPSLAAEPSAQLASAESKKKPVLVEKLPAFGGSPKASSEKIPKTAIQKPSAKNAPQPVLSAACQAKYTKEKPAAAHETAEAETGLQDHLDQAFAKGNVLLILLIVFLAGLGTALTPCVYPLIPITLSIFGARQASTKMQGFMLSSSYVGGMIALYTILGTTFAALGRMNGSALQSPLITIGIALFCIAMAASMFGAFDMTLPQSLQQKLNTVGGKGYGGAFLMGLVAGIIAAPCTGPILSSILVIIAKEGNVAQGGGLMFIYALGMGLPFLLLGTFSTLISRLPKSGNWMDVLKSVFGVLMFTAGLYFLQPIAPPLSAAFTTLAAFGAWAGPAAIVVGLALGALQLSFKNSSILEKTRKASGIILTTLGLLTFIAWASHSPEATASSKNATVAVGIQNVTSKVNFIQIGSEKGGLAKFDALLQKAKAECKPVMVDFFAEWCAACKELDKFTYPDPKVTQDSSRFLSIKIDATSEGEAPDALQERYGIVGLPTVLFFNGSGILQKKPRVLGFVTPEKYLPLMKKIH